MSFSLRGHKNYNFGVRIHFGSRILVKAFSSSDSHWTPSLAHHIISMSRVSTVILLASLARCQSIKVHAKPAHQILNVSQWSVAGSGSNYDANCRKNANGHGNCAHAENLIHGWTLGDFGSAWLGMNGDPFSQLWFCYDLGDIYDVTSISLMPSGHDTNVYKSKEYELWISTSPPGTTWEIELGLRGGSLKNA